MPPKPLFKPEMANRVERSKRALFSPDKTGASQQLESLLKRKRNACDDEDTAELTGQSSKLFRTDSSGASGLTPRALKIKSQSFCIGAGSSAAVGQVKAAQPAAIPFGQSRLSHGLSGSSSNLVASSSSSGTPLGNKLLRAHSEMSATPNSSMTDNQRKVNISFLTHKQFNYLITTSVFIKKCRKEIHPLYFTVRHFDIYKNDNLLSCRNFFGPFRRHSRKEKSLPSMRISVNMRRT